MCYAGMRYGALRHDHTLTLNPACWLSSGARSLTRRDRHLGKHLRGRYVEHYEVTKRRRDEWEATRDDCSCEKC